MNTWLYGYGFTVITLAFLVLRDSMTRYVGRSVALSFFGVFGRLLQYCLVF